MLDVRKLMLLHEVAMAGSIAGAARRVGYTRSAVSQQMSALESEAGRPLIDRRSNRVRLTGAGQTLVEHTERILVELRAAQSALESDHEPISGLLRIGIPFREGPRTMSAALTEVRRRFPELEVRLTGTRDEAAAEQLRRGDLDMAIVSRLAPAQVGQLPGLREWVLGHDPLRLCVPAGHWLAEAKCTSIAELRHETWVLSPTTALGRLTTALCQGGGFEPAAAATVDDLASAMSLVSIGWGVTIAPERTPEGREGTVRRIPLLGVEAVRHTVLMVRDGEHLARRIATVVAAVRDLSKQRLDAADT